MQKVIPIRDAVRLIGDGYTLGIGGNVLHRAPMALVREIVRQEKRQLTLVRTAGAIDIDLLCFGGCIKEVHTGFVQYETIRTEQTHYKRALKEGHIVDCGHNYATVIAALRAAQLHVPFLPVKTSFACKEEKSGCIAVVTDPFTGEETVVVKAIAPDVCILHVHEADELGNAILQPPFFEDMLLAKASGQVIVSAEKIADEPYETHHTEAALLPRHLVSAVVHVPYGAAPCSCQPNYEVDNEGVEEFLSLNNSGELEEWLHSYEHADWRLLESK